MHDLWQAFLLPLYFDFPVKQQQSHSSRHHKSWPPTHYLSHRRAPEPKLQLPSPNVNLEMQQACENIFRINLAKLKCSKAFITSFIRIYSSRLIFTSFDLSKMASKKNYFLTYYLRVIYTIRNCIFILHFFTFLKSSVIIYVLF